MLSGKKSLILSSDKSLLASLESSKFSGGSHGQGNRWRGYRGVQIRDILGISFDFTDVAKPERFKETVGVQLI